MKKLLVCCLLCICAFSLIGAKACNNSTQYGASGKAIMDIAATLHAGADSLDTLRKQNVITVDEEREALLSMQSLATLDGAYAVCIQAVHSSGSQPQTFIGCAQTFLSSVNDPAFLLSLHVKSPKATSTLEAVLSSVQALLNTTLSQLGGLPT